MLTAGPTQAEVRLLVQAADANPTDAVRAALFLFLTQSDNPAIGQPATFCLSIQLEKCGK